jgi:hypothetical protein
LLILLGLWAGLLPLVGPYFHFTYTPDHAWSFTTGRDLLEIAPAAAALLGGLILTISTHRAFAAFGAWLAALGGAWLVVGVALSSLWGGGYHIGTPTGGSTRQILEQIAHFSGVGVVIVFLAALALGRLTVYGAREASYTATADQTVPDTAVYPTTGL